MCCNLLTVSCMQGTMCCPLSGYQCNSEARKEPHSKFLLQLDIGGTLLCLVISAHSEAAAYPTSVTVVLCTMRSREVVKLAIALCFTLTFVESFTFNTHSLSLSKAAALRSAHCTPLAGKIKSSFGLDDQDGEVYTWDLEVRNSSKLLLCWLCTQFD